MKSIQDIVNDSGYPLQLHLEKLVNQKYKEAAGSWKIASREHKWESSISGNEGYIDLILENPRFLIKLVIECKKIDGSWIFLVPNGEMIEKQDLHFLLYDFSSDKVYWDESYLSPQTFQASFCVMENQGRKDNRTLEKLSNELLISLEYLALEDSILEKRKFQFNSSMTSGMKLKYLPIIVTTADLNILEFDPSNDIDISDGKLTNSKTRKIDYIRYRKNLASEIEKEEQNLIHLSEINKANDRTVFIVNAQKLLDFIDQIAG